MYIITKYKCSECGYETEVFTDFIVYDENHIRIKEKCPECGEET